MIVRGYFKEDAPYFAAHVLFTHFQGYVWFLADTGASRTLLSALDARVLGIQGEQLEPAEGAIVGLGGSVHSLRADDVRLTLDADDGYLPLRVGLFVAQYDWSQLPPDEITHFRDSLHLGAGYSQSVSFYLRLSLRNRAIGAIMN